MIRRIQQGLSAEGITVSLAVRLGIRSAATIDRTIQVISKNLERIEQACSSNFDQKAQILRASPAIAAAMEMPT